MPEKTIKRRLEELECQLAADDGPIFSTWRSWLEPICVCRGSEKKFREEISESAPVILCFRLTAINAASQLMRQCALRWTPPPPCGLGPRKAA